MRLIRAFLVAILSAFVIGFAVPTAMAACTFHRGDLIYQQGQVVPDAGQAESCYPPNSAPGHSGGVDFWAAAATTGVAVGLALMVVYLQVTRRRGKSDH